MNMCKCVFSLAVRSFVSNFNSKKKAKINFKNKHGDIFSSQVFVIALSD